MVPKGYLKQWNQWKCGLSIVFTRFTKQRWKFEGKALREQRQSRDGLYKGGKWRLRSELPQNLCALCMTYALCFSLQFVHPSGLSEHMTLTSSHVLGTVIISKPMGSHGRMSLLSHIYSWVFVWFGIDLSNSKQS